MCKSEPSGAWIALWETCGLLENSFQHSRTLRFLSHFGFGALRRHVPHGSVFLPVRLPRAVRDDHLPSHRSSSALCRPRCRLLATATTGRLTDYAWSSLPCFTGWEVFCTSLLWWKQENFTHCSKISQIDSHLFSGEKQRKLHLVYKWNSFA